MEQGIVGGGKEGILNRVVEVDSIEKQFCLKDLVMGQEPRGCLYEKYPRNKEQVQRS